nr:energy transducer TonB [Pseudomonadota bacterium]
TLLSPSLTRRDYPDALLRRAPRGGSVFIIVRVGADGSPLSCRTARSFGDPVVDAETCRLAVERFRFAPGRDEQGRAVADFFGYRQDFNSRF